MTGMLDVDLLANSYKIDLKGSSGTQPVLIQGKWHGLGDQADVNLDIRAKGIPIDDKLLAALRHAPNLQKLAKSFHATGWGDGRALICHTPGAPAHEFANEYHVQFHDSTVKWDEFGYPLEGVSGLLDVYPKYWEFHDFQGTHHAGRVTLRGRSDGSGDASRLVIDLEGRNISVDADLGAALHKMPALAKAWESFAPAGRMNFNAKIDTCPSQPQELDVAVGVNGCSIEPHFFRYLLTDLAGQFHYSRKENRVVLKGVSARHNGSRVSVGQGTVDLAPGDVGPSGAFYADLTDLRCDPLFPDDDLLKASPAPLKGLLEALKLRDPVALKTRLVITQNGESGSPPDIFWDGLVGLRDAKLQAGVELEHVTGTVGCRGRNDGRKLFELTGHALLDQATCFNQPFRNVNTDFQIRKNSPDVLLLGLKAPLFGGDISGQARLEFNSSMLRRYELDLTASQVRLEEFGAYNLGPEPKLSGLVQGRLYLTGQGAGNETLDGNGRLDVPDGKLIHLPLLLDLLKFLGLRWPDRTAFQEAHAVFGIHGKRALISRLDLLGNPVSLAGNGAVNLDGSDLQMNFYPTWGRTEQLLPALVRTVPSTLSKNLLKIEVRGKVGTKPGDLQFLRKPLPLLTDPVYQILRPGSGQNELTK
jgi:hypothetical protein